MLDVAKIRSTAEAGRPTDLAPVSLRWLNQVAEEIEEGRQARRQLDLIARGEVLDVEPSSVDCLTIKLDQAGWTTWEHPAV